MLVVGTDKIGLATFIGVIMAITSNSGSRQKRRTTQCPISNAYTDLQSQNDSVITERVRVLVCLYWCSGLEDISLWY